MVKTILFATFTNAINAKIKPKQQQFNGEMHDRHFNHSYRKL